MNQKVRKNNRSGQKGVHYNKNTKMWTVSIYIDKSLKILGYFKTKEEAIGVRKTAEIEHYGNFRRKE